MVFFRLCPIQNLLSAGFKKFYHLGRGDAYKRRNAHLEGEAYLIFMVREGTLIISLSLYFEYEIQIVGHWPIALEKGQIPHFQIP